MLKISVLFLILITFFGQKIMGQTPIQLDRPDQTECPFIVPIGYIQAENGLTFENANKINQSLAYPSTLWKLGISKNFELRLITELVSVQTDKETTTGITPITVGFKVNITEEKGLIPTTSFIGHLTVPNVAMKAFDINYYAPAYRFTMQHTLSRKLTLAYNLGTEWNGITPEPTFLYTLTTGFTITEKIGSYIEIYGFLPQKQSIDNRIDGGLTYLINNNMMFDISGGVGITENAPNHYLSLGFSYRFNSKIFK
jgi:Putative MetA-pathway of phenol degradation